MKMILQKDENLVQIQQQYNLQSFFLGKRLIPNLVFLADMSNFHGLDKVQISWKLAQW